MSCKHSHTHTRETPAKENRKHILFGKHSDFRLCCVHSSIPIPDLTNDNNSTPSHSNMSVNFNSHSIRRRWKSLNVHWMSASKVNIIRTINAYLLIAKTTTVISFKNDELIVSVLQFVVNTHMHFPAYFTGLKIDLLSAISSVNSKTSTHKRAEVL